MLQPSSGGKAITLADLTSLQGCALFLRMRDADVSVQYFNGTAGPQHSGRTNPV